MTRLSVNVNKIALLRNSRGRNYPDLLYFVRRIISFGVTGITVHPREDERHVTKQDVREIAALLRDHPQVEFNIEGYPSLEFLALIREVKPAQCTLVPDSPKQLTSDHGWNIENHHSVLHAVISELHGDGIRSSLFLDPQPEAAALAAETGTDRIELYTEEFARAYGNPQEEEVFARYLLTAQNARAHGIGVNAGHDLDLRNLTRFLQIPAILEVSIGHALIVEALEQGMENVIKQYLQITGE